MKATVMSDISILPFESVQRAAETLSDPRIKSQFLAELAQQQLSTRQFDAALQTLAAIPLPKERRTALLVADLHTFPPEMIETLTQLLKMDSQTQFLAGQLALAMLEGNNTHSAWKLVETAKNAFESEQQRYDFLEKALTQLQTENWDKVLSFYQTFTTDSKRDWALLAMIKYLVGKQRFDEAEQFAMSIASPLRRSWACWEMSRWSPAKPSELYFNKAIEIIETIEMTSDDEELLEKLATQLRIYGRTAFQRNRNDLGERLLERSEAATASLTLPMQRFRLQCFLGKVLVELKQITSIQEYLVIDTMMESLRSGLDRSRVLVWLAEAGWTKGWTQAIETLSVPERGVTELERSQQIVGVLQSFVAHYQELEATGNSSEDALRISGEEFETRYFSPFAEADCGCSDAIRP